MSFRHTRTDGMIQVLRAPSLPQPLSPALVHAILESPFFNTPPQRFKAVLGALLCGFPVTSVHSERAQRLLDAGVNLDSDRFLHPPFSE